jgi:pyridoxine 5-phosphate synthase
MMSMNVIGARDVALGVNIDHVATVRQARRARFPDPLLAALTAEQAGADSITLHLREDRRHIQDHDVERFAASLQTRMNLEMAAIPEMIAIATRIRPADVCLVPERRTEVTTEGGLDAIGGRATLAAATSALEAAGVSVSLFIDPDPRQIEAALAIGAPAIELHTGAYAEACHTPRRAAEFKRLCVGASLGKEGGLTINAGHGINYVNIAEVRTIPHLHELNVGHSIVSRALFTGIEEAVCEMKARMNGRT